MYCENFRCIYEEEGECTLEFITINADGMCEECIYPKIPDEILEKLKAETRKKLEEEDGM